MTARPRVVIAHTLFSTIEVEARILEPLGVDLVWCACPREEDLIAAASSANVLMIAGEPVTRHVVERLRHCRVIVKCGVGVDNIDVAAATEHGIYVANVPDYGIDEVATHAMALLLNGLRRVTDAVLAVRGGTWLSTPPVPVRRSAGRTLGIVGLGRIGRSVARKAGGFGWRLLVADPFVASAVIRDHRAEPVDLTMLLAESDFVTLHVPPTSTTRHLIDAAALDRMPAGAYLVNTSRGAVVDTRALYRALDAGHLAGAALDVLEDEPPAPDHPLLTCPRALITSHVAWYSVEAVHDLRTKAAWEVARVVAGEAPKNLLNPAVRARTSVHST